MELHYRPAQFQTNTRISRVGAKSGLPLGGIKEKKKKKDLSAIGTNKEQTTSKQGPASHLHPPNKAPTCLVISYIVLKPNQF